MVTHNTQQVLSGCAIASMQDADPKYNCGYIYVYDLEILLNSRMAFSSVWKILGRAAGTKTMKKQKPRTEIRRSFHVKITLNI